MPVPNELTAPAAEGARELSGGLHTGDVLPVRPNFPFFFVFYPDSPGNWFIGEIEAGPGVPEADVGVWWLPALQKEPIHPGINLHRTRKKGEAPEAAYDNAHLAIRRNGGIVLSHDLGYVKELDCRDPRTQREGKYHAEAWSKPAKSRRQGKRLKFAFDRQRYYRWLLALMREGILPTPADDIIAENVERLQARVARRETQTDLTPEKRAELSAEAALEAEKAESAKIPAEEVKPKKTGSRSAKEKADA
jgi:hypothetical protein